MSDIWKRLEKIQDLFINTFNKTGTEIHEDVMDRFVQPGWVNRVWVGPTYRRAHLNAVDLRDSKGLWLIHCCIFPHTNNSSPIFGYDVVAGKNKITGFFHDFSSTGDADHPLIDWFGREVDKFEWRKKRDMPDWAKLIFSPHIIGIGNVQKEDELDQILNMITTNLIHYLDCLDESNGLVEDNTENQNFYCKKQKENPHSARILYNLGLSDEDVNLFIEECLFPEIR